MSESTTRRLKVAYILTPIIFGGAEKVSLNFLRTVDRSKFDLHPILLTRPWEEESHFAREIRRMGYDYDSLPVAVKTGSDPFRVFRVAWLLYALLKRGDFHRVHTHGYFADICGLPAARLLGLASVSTCHGFIANDRKLKVYNLLDTRALQLCRSIIAVSDVIRTGLVRNGIPETRITVIPNAVAPPHGPLELEALRLEKRSAIGLEPCEPVVGYLGRLSEEKGLVYLVEAVAEMSMRKKPVKLLLVGDGPQRATLERQVQANALGDLVIFAGFQADAENWLPALDVFALPSLTEGTPMALLEAMGAGVPVIASRVGGVPKVVTDGINGLLVPPGNSKALSDGIEELISNSTTSRQIVQEGRNTIITRYGIQSWCRSIEALYSA